MGLGLAMLGLGAMGLIGGIGGSYMQGQQQAGMNREQREWSAEQATISRDWQKSMSNTAYQRSMADMRKAGLNPILAAGGGGASTGPGAMGQGVAAQVPDYGAAFTRGTSSAVEGLRLGQEKKRLDQELKNMKQKEALDFETKRTKLFEGMNQEAQAHQAEEQTKAIKTQNILQETKVPAAKAEMKFDETALGEWLRKLNRFTGSTFGNMPVRGSVNVSK